MNRIFSLLFVLFLLVGFSYDQNNSLSNNSTSGIVIEGLSLKSSLLNSDVKYAIYLPPDYEESISIMVTILIDKSE